MDSKFWPFYDLFFWWAEKKICAASWILPHNWIWIWEREVVIRKPFTLTTSNAALIFWLFEGQDKGKDFFWENQFCLNITDLLSNRKITSFLDHLNLFTLVKMTRNHLFFTVLWCQFHWWIPWNQRKVLLFLMQSYWVKLQQKLVEPG